MFIIKKKWKEGFANRSSYILTIQGLEGLLPPVPESDGVSPEIVPVSEPDGELPSELLGSLLFDGSPVLLLSLVVLLWITRGVLRDNHKF